MIRIPYKRLPAKIWLQIVGIWTLAAISIATQIYLNAKDSNPDIKWFTILFKQLPTWYLCALLTPVIVYVYEKFPLDIKDWKSNFRKHLVIALLILIVFSHFRLWAMSYIIDKMIWTLTPAEYFNNYLAQIAIDLAIYAFIMSVIFADKANTRRQKNELYSAQVELKNKQLEQQLDNARLDALKLQLSPHFLFNTLNTINSLIRSKDYSLAIKANSRLGDFLRATLDSENTQLVSLEKEMNYIDLYLEIETLRYADRLQVIKEISPDCLSVQVPYFILQPIVENAIKHGLAQKSSAKKLVIKAHIQKNYMEIIIINEGNPLSKNWEANNGIGIKNVCERLNKTYGRNCFEIANDVTDNGVQVTLKIPVGND
ncbi:MAG: Histidine kinase [Daejeonella sp.]|nr:Histidine kinase [Daejeonella sp.]